MCADVVMRCLRAAGSDLDFIVPSVPLGSIQLMQMDRVSKCLLT